MNITDVKNGFAWLVDETTGKLIKDPVTLPGHPSKTHCTWIFSRQAVQQLFKVSAKEICEAKRLESKHRKQGYLPLKERHKLAKLRKQYRRSKGGKMTYLTPKKEAICPMTGKVIKLSQLRMRDAKRPKEIFLTAAFEAILENPTLRSNPEKAIRQIKAYFGKLTLAQKRRHYNQLAEYRSGVTTGMPKEQVEFLVKTMELYRQSQATRRRAA